MDTIDQLITQRAAADSAFLASIGPARDEYRLALDRLVRAETAYLADPLSEDREAQSKAARDEFDRTRTGLDNQVKGAKAARTKKLNDAWNDASKKP